LDCSLFQHFVKAKKYQKPLKMLDAFAGLGGLMTPRVSRTLVLTKGQGFICCLVKAALSATLSKQLLSHLATYDPLSLVNHKAQPNSVWIYIVDIFTALIDSW
jgi:hypothetical protein